MYVLMIFAIVFTACALTVLLYRAPLSIEKPHFSLSRRIFWSVPFLFGALVMLRMFTYENGQNYAEWISDSVLLALRTFMLDGDISVHRRFIDIDDAILKLFAKESTALRVGFGMLLKAIEIFLDIIAPMVTLTAVLNLLSELFPKIKIAVFNKREKYVFSELNEETVVLIESIYQSNLKAQKKKSFWQRLQEPMPMLIIADVYVAEFNEKGSELLDCVRRIGCICIKDDIISLRVSAKKKLSYVLSDYDKMKNLSAALKLSQTFQSSPKSLKRLNYLYVFSDLEEAEELMSKQCHALLQKIELLNAPNQKKIGKKLSVSVSSQGKTTSRAPLAQAENHTGCHCSRMELSVECEASDEKNNERKNSYHLPFLIPVKEYKNIIYDLFERVPLYQPLIGTNRKELNVTILGTGFIGKEAFLAAYWCGQMLGFTLNLTVISLNATDGFKDQINRINPMIFNAAKHDAYCNIALIGCDLRRVNFDSLLAYQLDAESPQYSIETYGTVRHSVGQTDYYIVSLGCDELNITTAYELRKAVERIVLKETEQSHNAASSKQEQAVKPKTVIAASIYDSSLAPSVAYSDDYLQIHPFASFRSRYSYENIINKRFVTGAQEISAFYESLTTTYAYTDMQEIYGDTASNYSYYKYWSNIARRLHQKYMIFSVTGHDAANCLEEYIDKLRDDSLCAALAWNEHRRWNSLLRTMGYLYHNRTKNCTEQKVHPCLVEIEWQNEDQQPYWYHHKLPFYYEMVNGKRMRRCMLRQQQLTEFPYDALDYTCGNWDAPSTEAYSCDTKMYDYPQHSNFLLSDADIKRYLHLEAKDYYSSKENPDFYSYELYSYQYKGGKRLWSIHRYLLDEQMKQGIQTLYATGRSVLIPQFLTSLYRKEYTPAQFEKLDQTFFAPHRLSSYLQRSECIGCADTDCFVKQRLAAQQSDVPLQPLPSPALPLQEKESYIWEDVKRMLLSESD